MAELRRVGGEMVAHRRPAGRRVLLPAEVELCQTVGLSEEDYWHFVELTDRYIAQRPEGYELIPDVRNDPVTLFIINLVIGIAMTALGALLAPKPQEPKTPPSRKTADVKGQSRFAPQTAFDSVQELADLGAIIPLVFTRKGVRVSAQLLWSQMWSLGTGQQLRALLLFSSGQLEARPDFAGYAIGDSLLENYTNAKIALYFKTNGGRIAENSGDRYAEGTALSVPHSDAFSIFWEPSGSHQPYFSGTRTPSTQTQFGVFSPMPSGIKYKLDYELILKPKDADDDLKKDIKTKRQKVLHTAYPRRAAIVAYDGHGLVYRLDGSSDDGKGFKPWGTEDVRSFVESERVASDDAIAIGDSYMAGDALLVAEGVPTEPWRDGYTKDVWFRVVEGGSVDVSSPFDQYHPSDRLILQRAATATVSTNRMCDCTELGLKSTVYRQITGFPNVNSYPGDQTIAKYERNNGSFTLGSLSKYIYRLSFFTLQARHLGVNAGWQDISGGSLFCIRGSTPQPQYNYIRIHHTRGQYEFRLRPYPGNLAFRHFRNREVWQLTPGNVITYHAGEYLVSFSGRRLRLSESITTNPEWVLGTPPPPPEGKVIGVNWSQNGAPPPERRFVEERYTTGASKNYAWYERYKGRYTYYWDTEVVGTSKAGTNIPRETIGDDGNVYVVGSFKGSGYQGSTTFYTIKKYSQGIAPPAFRGVVGAGGGSGSGLTFYVETWSNGASTWRVESQGIGYQNGQTVYIPQANVNVVIFTDENNFVASSLNPYDAIADCSLFASLRSSHDDGPEHEVVYVNEQLAQDVPQYERLAMAGLRINSSKEWTSFSSLSAYIKRGVVVERLTTSGTSATNLLPEIAYALLTNREIGAGGVIGSSQVNRARMTEAARFCEANGFTWDGVLSERVNLRQWIFEQAGYCLLDFTILGGQFSLVPSVPYGADYLIAHTAQPTIKALFTDGNIRKLQVSFLSPEERRLFTAVVQWRRDRDNGFPQTRVFSMRLADSEGGSDADPEESFDMSGFCTTQAHAMTFAKYALRTRQKVDHGLKFETTPQAAMGLAPGDYFRLVSEVTHTSRFQNGSIDAEGFVTCVGDLQPTSTILYWLPGTEGVSEATLVTSGGKTTQSELFGTVFAIKNTSTTNRVYKVETLSYAEDGLVEVAASYAPLTDSGSLAVLDWPDNAFDVEVG